MKMGSWVVTLVAALAGSAPGAAAPAGRPVTVRFPALSKGECPLVLQGGELSVSSESGKLAFAFKGTATMKTSCSSKSELFGSVDDGPVPAVLAITNLTIVVDAATASGPSVVSMTADKVEAAPE